MRYTRQPMRGGLNSGGRPLYANPPPETDGPGMVNGRIDSAQTEQVAPAPPTAAGTWLARPWARNDVVEAGSAKSVRADRTLAIVLATAQLPALQSPTPRSTLPERELPDFHRVLASHRGRA